MDKEIVVRLHLSFEEMARTDVEGGPEYWLARDLQLLLGYAHWRSFADVIDKAMTACEKSRFDPKDHFAHARKMVDLGSSAKREIQDIALTRYACYLIAQNGDPAKDQIAFAQTYFAVQTRKQRRACEEQSGSPQVAGGSRHHPRIPAARRRRQESRATPAVAGEETWQTDQKTGRFGRGGIGAMIAVAATWRCCNLLGSSGRITASRMETPARQIS